MPAGNATGPMGLGPMTGRGAGFCAGFGVPGYANRPGMIAGFSSRFRSVRLVGRWAVPMAGSGRGRGRRRGFGPGGGRGRR